MIQHDPFAPAKRTPARSTVLGVRATAREREVLRKLASRQGVTVTEFVRAALAERVRRLHADDAGQGGRW